MLNKLFKKKEKQVEPGKPAPLRKPEEIPYAVGRDLVVLFKRDPDMVWKLKAVMRPKDGSPTLREFRVFSPSQAAQAGVQVRDYNSFDDYPQLVMFHGWFNKKNNEAQVFEGGSEDRLAS